MWKTLAIGDTVAPDASLRVGPASSVELTRGAVRLTLLEPNIYQVAELVKAREKLKGTGLARAVAQKASALAQERVKQGTVGGSRAGTDTYKGIRAEVALRLVGGTRAATGDTSGSSPVWVEETGETGQEPPAPLSPEIWKGYMEKSRTMVLEDMIKFGNLDRAVAELGDAIELAPDPRLTAEPRYLLATVYSMAGQPLRAYRVLEQTPPELLDQDYTALFMLMKAQILVDVLDFQGAQALVKPLIAAGNPPARLRRMAYLLLGVTQRGLGDEKAARASFNAGYAIDQSSDWRKLIAAELGK